MTDPKKMTVAERHRLAAVLQEIRRERHRQHAKWGAQPIPDGTAGLSGDALVIEVAQRNEERRKVECDEAAKAGECTHRLVLDEEIAEAYAANTPEDLRAELVQVAAVVSKWIEQIDARLEREREALRKVGP